MEINQLPASARILGKSQQAAGRDLTEVTPEDIYNHHHDHWLKESWETEIVQNCPQLECIDH